MGHTWTRAAVGPVRVLPRVLLGLLLGGAAGCSADDSDPAAAPSRTADATTEAAPVEELPCVPGVRPFTGPAAEEFGPDRVMAAYCGLVELSLEHAFTALVLPAPDRSPAEYAAVRRHLTPPARRHWDGLVRAFLATGDREASRRIDALTLHDLTAVPAGYEIDPDGPYSFGEEVGPATAALVRTRSGAAGLRLTFPVRTGIVLSEKGDDSGRHLLLPMTKRVTFEVATTQDGSGPWLVDDWRATWRTGGVRPVTAP